MDRQVKALYFSPTGGTEKVVKEVAQGISNNYSEYNITLKNKRKDILTFDSKDLLIVGLPVYAGRVPKLLIDYFSHIKGHNTPVILIAVYGNRAYEDALIEMYDMLHGKGFIPVSAGAFIGEHSYTKKVGYHRPDRKDLALAKDFALTSYKLIQENNLERISLRLPGNRPYKELVKGPSFGPSLKPSCILCGICVSNCPTEALTIEDTLKIDDTKCIHCCSCVKKCPQNALELGGMANVIREKLLENCSDYKVPEIFFASST